MRNWTVPVRGWKDIEVRAQKKKEAEDLARAIRDLIAIRHWRRKLTGIRGVDERSSLYLSIGGDLYPLVNPAKYQEDLKQFLSSIDRILVVDVQGVTDRARLLFERHVPVEDERQTQAEFDAECQRQQVVEAEVKQKNDDEKAAFVAEWCLPDEVTIPAGHMPVVLRLTFDNSDIGSDYFHPYAQIGWNMLLGTVPLGQKKENTLRNILSRYPNLASLQWTYHKEDYSMGHGRFLISEWRGVKVNQSTYGRDEVDTRFEIRFGSTSKTLHPYRGYKAEISHHSAEAVAESAGFTATVSLNSAKNGVELRFFGTPPSEALESARAAGFRQNRWKTFWYARQDETTIAFARKISGEQQESSEVSKGPIHPVEKEKPAAAATPISPSNINQMEQFSLFAA